MIQVRRIYKALALASSILLVGGYVSYRANAFPWRPVANPEDSPNDYPVDSMTLSGGDSAATIVWEPVMMSGSKSGNGIAIKIDGLNPTSTAISLNQSTSALTDPNATQFASSGGGPPTTQAVPAGPLSDATIISSSKSFSLSPQPQRAAASRSARTPAPRAGPSANAPNQAANGPPRQKSQAAERLR